MDSETLISSQVQDRVRNLINKIMIEKNMKRYEVSQSSKIGTTMLWKFLNKKVKVGERAMKGFIHFLLVHGYTIDELMDQ